MRGIVVAIFGSIAFWIAIIAISRSPIGIQATAYVSASANEKVPHGDYPPQIGEVWTYAQVYDLGSHDGCKFYAVWIDYVRTFMRCPNFYTTADGTHPVNHGRSGLTHEPDF